MARLLLIRHAPVVQKGLCYGRFDPPTEEIGCRLPQLVEQVRALIGERTLEIQKVITSPAGRCRKVAEPLRASLGLSLEIEERIAELHMGIWEGSKYAQLEGDPEFEHWMRNYEVVAPPKGESLSDLEARLRNWLSEMPSPGDVIAVTHAGVIRALSVILRGDSWGVAMQSSIDHLKPYIFESS